jgi:hypothetical protein
MTKQVLYIPCDMDMAELAMEIQNQFDESDEVHVYYESGWEEFGISAGDFLGAFTIEGLKKEGYLT